MTAAEGLRGSRRQCRMGHGMDGSMVAGIDGCGGGFSRCASSRGLALPWQAVQDGSWDGLMGWWCVDCATMEGSSHAGRTIDGHGGRT
eukprot:scaffold306224_cov15-Tisochrysis_lutea.AAC.2